MASSRTTAPTTPPMAETTYTKPSALAAWPRCESGLPSMNVTCPPPGCPIAMMGRTSSISSTPVMVARKTMPTTGSSMVKTTNGIASAISNGADSPGITPAAAAIMTAAPNVIQ